jgi:hypothetical protein
MMVSTEEPQVDLRAQQAGRSSGQAQADEIRPLLQA